MYHADVPNFPVYCCNLHGVLGIISALWEVILPSQTRTWRRQQAFNSLQQPRVLYKGLFSSTYCTALLWRLWLQQTVCFTKGSKTPVELHNQNAFLRLPCLSWQTQTEMGVPWSLYRTVRGGRLRIATIKQLEKDIKLLSKTNYPWNSRPWCWELWFPQKLQCQVSLKYAVRSPSLAAVPDTQKVVCSHC